MNNSRKKTARHSRVQGCSPASLSLSYLDKVAPSEIEVLQRINAELDAQDRARNRETLQVFVEDYCVDAYVNEKDSMTIVDFAGMRHMEDNKVFPSNELITKLGLAIQAGVLKKGERNWFTQHRNRFNRPFKQIKALTMTWCDEIDKVDAAVYGMLARKVTP